MATGRTFIQQTFLPLSIPQVTSNSLIFYPNSSITCLPLSLLHLTQTWPPLIYLRSHTTRPHCLAQAPRRPPELMQLPPHSPSSPALFPIKAGLILPFPCCTSVCFTSEAKSQPSGTEKQDKPGCLNKTFLFPSPRRNCYSSQVRGQGDSSWEGWEPQLSRHLLSTGMGSWGRGQTPFQLQTILWVSSLDAQPHL